MHAAVMSTGIDPKLPSLASIGTMAVIHSKRTAPSFASLSTAFNSNRKTAEHMAARLNPPLVEIYALNEHHYREPVAGVPGAFRRLHQPYIVYANVLGDALKKLELARSVKITPYDGSGEHIKFAPGEQPKYFFYETPDGARTLVDIHIRGRGEEICPKQNLSFALRDGDIIVPDILIC
jgi:hypothetical protein